MSAEGWVTSFLLALEFSYSPVQFRANIGDSLQGEAVLH